MTSAARTTRLQKYMTLSPLAIFAIAWLAVVPAAVAQWRPVPTRAAPPVVAVAPGSGDVTFTLRYKTWDGYFLDAVTLPAGEAGERRRRGKMVWPPGLCAAPKKSNAPLAPPFAWPPFRHTPG